MQDDPTPFASAPEPDAVPAAAPVTSATPSGDPSGAVPRPRRTALALVAAIVVFDLLVAAGAWYYLSPKGGAVAVSASAGVETALRSRVATEYPGFVVTRVSSSELDYSAEVGGGSDWVYYFDMQSNEQPGFEYTARYFAQLSRRSEPVAYVNYDDFFLAGAAPSATVASFMHMWVFSHPGEKCIDVSVTWDSAATTETCVVDYVRLERTGASVTSTSGAYAFEYSPEIGSGAQVAIAATPSPAEDTVTVAASALLGDGSLPDTQTAVAHALPGFKAIGVATYANGDPLVLVRHTRFPGLRMTVEPSSLYPPDPADDMVALFGGDRVRADAFARAWTSAHRGTIIDMLSFDPSDSGDTKLLDVYFVNSVAEVDDTRYEKDVEYRYHPKTHVWTKAK